MNNPTRLILVSGAAGLAGALIMLLVLRTGASVASADSLPAMHARTGETALCTRAWGASEEGFYAEMDRANTRMHRGMEIAPTGDPDRDFARLMIPHHQGAIDMALVQLKYGRDQRLKRLAQSIVVEQNQEIAYMRTLLDAPPRETSIAAVK
jgi:uncharacterized protein (DUF305 family)